MDGSAREARIPGSCRAPVARRAAPIGQRLPCSRCGSSRVARRCAASVRPERGRATAGPDARIAPCPAWSHLPAPAPRSPPRALRPGWIDPPPGRLEGSSGSIRMRAVPMARDLLAIGLAGRVDANGRTPHRVDHDTGPTFERAGQPASGPRHSPAAGPARQSDARFWPGS